MVRCMPRLRLTIAIGASMAAAACRPAEAPPTPSASDPVTQAAEPRQDVPEEQRSPDLFGAWLVHSVSTTNYAPRDRSWNMIVFVGVDQLEVLSQCITVGPFDYGRTVGGGIVVRQISVSPRPRATPTPALTQCARALSTAESAMPPILLAALDVKREADGSVMLSGQEGKVILRRPPGALGNPRGQAPPPRVPPLLGAWRFLSVNGRTLLPDESIELLLRPRHLEWRSGCVSEVREMRSEGDKLIPGDSDLFPICERGLTEAERSASRLFTDTVATRMGQDGRLRVQGSGVTAELIPLVS